MNSVNNQTNNIKLKAILHEYSRLPEYSEMDIPEVNTRSLFGDYPINIAATRGLINEVITLLSNGSDIDAKGEHGYTPLHDAVEQGHIETVKFLVNHGASITIKNDDGDTPIGLAKLLQESYIYHYLKKLAGSGLELN